jgi:hypothetical protein
MGTTKGSEQPGPDPVRQQEAAANTGWQDWGQRPGQGGEADRRPRPAPEPWDVYPEDQQDKKKNVQEASEGKKDPMANQPKRGSEMAPADQQRAMEVLAKPGQFDWVRPEQEEHPEPDGAGPPQEAAPEENAAAGSADGAQGGAVWAAWNSSKKAAGQADPSSQGIPEGSERIPNTIGFRVPASDFMYHKGWEPRAEAIHRDGRNYLTKESQHAKEVHAKQLPSRRIFLESYSYPDGMDGLTFRQLLEAIATVQGALSLGQREALAGAFGKWMAEGNGGHAKPPSFDDCWCLCGQWVFASAVFCVCGMPTGRCRTGDWMCGKCRHTNFASRRTTW